MFFPALELLRDSEKLDSSLEAFDKLLCAIQNSGYDRRFNPRVYKYFGFRNIYEKDWVYFLDILTLHNFLDKTLELECPNCQRNMCADTQEGNLPLNKEITCPHCFNAVTTAKRDIFLTYGFTNKLADASEGCRDFFRREVRSYQHR